VYTKFDIYDFPPCYSYSQVELDTTRYKYLTLDIYNLIVVLPVLINFPKGHSEKIHGVIIMTDRIKADERRKNCLPFRSSPPGFSEVRVTRSLVVCIYFVDRFCPFSFGHCVVCSSSIYIQ
jgi:hypothetical protein